MGLNLGKLGTANKLESHAEAVESHGELIRRPSETCQDPDQSQFVAATSLRDRVLESRPSKSDSEDRRGPTTTTRSARASALSGVDFS